MHDLITHTHDVSHVNYCLRVGMRLATGCTGGLISDVLPGGVLKEEVRTRYNCAQATNVNKAGTLRLHTYNVCVPTTHHLNLRLNYLTPANSSFMNCSVHWMLPDTNRTTSTSTTILPVPENKVPAEKLNSIGTQTYDLLITNTYSCRLTERPRHAPTDQVKLHPSNEYPRHGYATFYQQRLKMAAV